MCTLAVYSRTFREYPLVIAANRDEFFDRESLEPELVPSAPAIYCGRDGIHGGTWLGVNAEGVAAALLNRRTLTPLTRAFALVGSSASRRSPTPRRRLPRVRSPTSRMLHTTRSICSLPMSDVWVFSNPSARLISTRLKPGLHLLTNLDVDDPDARASRLRRNASLRFCRKGRRPDRR